MTTLIYHSKANDLGSSEELESFLTTIRLENIRLNITGVLLYNEGQIMQIIEGENAAIIELFEKIKIDKRHKDIVKIVDFKMQERCYEDWSMAFKAISNKDWSTVKGYLNIDDNITSLIKNTSKRNYIKMLIATFVNEEIVVEG